MNILPTPQQCIDNFNIWQGGACQETFYNLIWTGPNNQIQFNPQGMQEVQNDFIEIFNNYLQSNTITIPGDMGYNSFQETLRETCQSLPGACDPALQSFCGPLSREQISDNAGLLSFCGCFSPDTSDSNLKAPVKECDPLCSRVENIPLSDGKGNALYCTTPVCVIDNISINAVNSIVQGTGVPVNFQQYCPACSNSEQPCRCIIGGISISGTINQTGIPDEIRQNCGDNSLCLQIIPGQPDKQINCTDAFSNEGKGEQISTWGLFTFIFIVILLLTIVLAIIIGKRR